MSDNSNYEVTRKLIKHLRQASKELKQQSIIIPDECEKYGFAQGSHDLNKMLDFLASMLE